MVLLGAISAVWCGVMLTLVTVTPAEAGPARPIARTATTVAEPPSTAAPTVAPTDPPVTTVADTTPDTTPYDTTPVTEPEQQWVPPSYEQPVDTTPNYGGSQQAATPPSTTDNVTMTTTQNLLVGPPPSTVTTTTIPAQDLTSKNVERKAGGSDPLLWAIVAGLAVVGIALGVTTFLYWKRTHPEAAEGPPAGRGRRQSRYSDLVITVPKAP